MKTKNTNKTKKIFKRSIALDLRNRGFKIVGTEPNKCKPQFDVYLFEDTDEFEKALAEVVSSNYMKI